MNADGKTSASGFIGVYLGLIAGLSFVGTMVGYFLGVPETVDVMDNIIQLVFATSLLLGVRKAGDFMKRRRGGSSVSTETTTTSEFTEPQAPVGEEGDEPIEEEATDEDPDNPR